MDLVFSEVLVALFAGRMLLVTLLMLVGGYLVGWGTASFGGRVGWSVLVLFIATCLFVTSAYIREMTLASASGVLPSGFADSFIVSLILVLLGLYFIGLWAGSSARSLTRRNDFDIASRMSARDFVAEIEMAAAHPGLGQSGWFGSRWYAMSADERLAWVEGHLGQLRSLRVEILDGNLLGHGAELPVRLAQIDR